MSPDDATTHEREGANIDDNCRILFDADAAIDYNARHEDLRAGQDILRMIQLIHAWQRAHGLAADGKLGPATRASLDAAMKAPLAVPHPGELVATETAQSGVPSPRDVREVVIASCDEATRERVYYDLGAGGSAKRPAWPPWDEARKCDCSAFVCGALGFHRNAENCNTGKMVADAVRFDRQRRRVLGKGAERLFVYRGMIWAPAKPNPTTAEVAQLAASLLELLPTIKPGDVIVHDGVYDPDTGQRVRPGHTGIVKAIHLERFDPAHPERWYTCVEVVDCSPSNSHAAGEPGHAIAAHDAAAWAHEAMFLTYQPFAARGI